jgi:hypothetical protein
MSSRCVGLSVQAIRPTLTAAGIEQDQFWCLLCEANVVLLPRNHFLMVKAQRPVENNVPPLVGAIRG